MILMDGTHGWSWHPNDKISLGSLKKKSRIANLYDDGESGIKGHDVSWVHTVLFTNGDRCRYLLSR